MVFEKIVEKLKNYVDDTSSITPETTLEDLGLDSLDIMEIVMELEGEFNTDFQISEKLETVGALVKLIEERIGA